MADPGKIITSAVEFCMAGSSGFRTKEEVVKALNSGDTAVNSRFRQFVAREVSSLLAKKYESRLKALRLYGSTAELNACTFSDIDLIAVVTDLPPDFNRTVRKMDKVLSSRYYELLGKEKCEWSYLLDIHVIDEDPQIQIHPSKAYLKTILINESVAV